MQKAVRRITEATLDKDLNELAGSFIRELAMACKKMSIYGSEHPLARKAVGPPFLVLGQIFTYKKLFTLNVHRGDLYLCNIALKESVFYFKVMQFLQILDVNTIVIDRTVSLEEMTDFIHAVVKRDSLYKPEYKLGGYLAERNITSIQINSELGFKLFEKRKLYRGEVEGNYSVRRLALDQIGDSVERVGRILVSENDLIEFNIDFDQDIISYLIPERVAKFSVDEFVAAITKASSSDSEDSRRDYLALLAIAESHPESDSIRERMQIDNSTIIQAQETADPVISIKNESSDRIDKLMIDLFKPKFESNDILAFADGFSRLLKTGQYLKADSVINDLMDRLADDEASCRQMSLSLLDGAIHAVQSKQDYEIVDSIIQQLLAKLSGRNETFEYSELIRLLFWKSLMIDSLAHLSVLCEGMSAQRESKDGVTVYESLAIKKALEYVNRTEIIDSLIEKLINARHEEAGHLKTILCTIGSEEVALSLAKIISHPIRQVRQNALKILADLGHAALTVFGRMMHDDRCFKRESGRQELPDESWYIVRNTVFVLGSLGDPAGIEALRIRLADPDIRVRREIISAAEKIRGEAAVDLLILLADDAVSEIRGAALISLGIIGTAEIALLIIDIAHRHPTEAAKAVTVLGKIGGPDASAYLGRLLYNEEEFNSLSGGKVPKEELRVAVIKALAAIGDDTSRKQIKSFSDGMSKTQKILFKNSPINKTLNEVLSRRSNSSQS